MYRSPFTASQWQELEHQALILKYLMAGVPVPPDLLLPIRRSFGSVPACFYPTPTLGYYSYFGKKLDPEPGRCRRTDGKKWRCSKDAYPDSKYCERHMHRGKNRSRKPVESQALSQSQSSSSTVTELTRTGSVSRSYQNSPVEYSIAGSGNIQGSNSSPYGVINKDHRYLSGVKTDVVDEHSFISVASATPRDMGLDSSLDSSWRLMPSQVSPFSLTKPRTSEPLFPHPQLHTVHHQGLGHHQQQRSSYSFLGSDFGLSEPVKHESNSSLQPFFDEWPRTRDLWTDLDDQRSNQISFSNTKLSISIPMTSSDFSTTTSSRSPNNE